MSRIQLIFSFTIGLLAISHVVLAKDSCEKKANTLVNKLETVWVDLEGVAQGDYDEKQLDIELIQSTRETNSYRIAASHTNEDNEDWTNTYEVTLRKDDCYIKSYKFLGSK